MRSLLSSLYKKKNKKETKKKAQLEKLKLHAAANFFPEKTIKILKTKGSNIEKKVYLKICF